MTKSDIDSIISRLIDQSFDGNIDIHNHTEFEENLRGVFRILYGMKCKNFFADGQCQRMKNYDKKFISKE